MQQIARFHPAVAAWFELPDGRDATGFLEETADRFRGETFVLTASAPGTPDPSTGIDHGRAAPGSPPATAVRSRVESAHPRGGRS